MQFVPDSIAAELGRYKQAIEFARGVLPDTRIRELETELEEKTQQAIKQARSKLTIVVKTP